MAAEADTVQWHYQGDIQRTIREATMEWDASVDVIVDVLSRHELDAPRDRIQKLVEAAIENIETTNEQESSTNRAESAVEPRTTAPRVFDALDAAYLDDQALASILGAALSRYEGRFRTPERPADSVIDLYWNRKHTTIGLRTIATGDDEPVDEDDVRTVIESDPAPATGRHPSTIGIATTGPFTESASSLAAAEDIELYGSSYLERWFRHAALPWYVAGPILEEDELTFEEIDELLADLPAIPEPASSLDPLREDPHESASVRVSSTGVVPDVDTRIPVRDERSPRGQKGELYADPKEDGDFAAFDRFEAELEAIEDEI